MKEAFTPNIEMPAVLVPGHISYLAPVVILAIFLVSKVSRMVQVWNFSREHQCRKPAVVRTYFLGIGQMVKAIDSFKKGESLEYVRSLFNQHGNTLKSRMVRSFTATIEPRNVQAILATKFKDFELGDNRKKSFEPLLGQGIFASDGPIWEHSRALVRPNFVRNQVADIEVYERHVSKVIANIPHDGSTIDLQDLFFRMTIDSATEFLFGESVNSLNTKEQQSSFAEDFNKAQDGLSIRARMGPLKALHRDRDFSRSTIEARHYVSRFVQKALDYRSAQNGEKDTDNKMDQRYVFLYELSKQTADKKVLTDQLLNILLAGRDTTASLLSITFFVLARRPEIWNKLRSDVLRFEGERPSFEDLKSMTYLSWVINETLRLYPVVPINLRSANKDTFLPVGGGPDGKDPVFVPKGQEVMYSVYSMHRLPEIYGPDATEYRPERWANLKPGWAYIPFNGGPRICIGQQFALTEAGYTIARIVRHFKSIESRDTRPFKEGLTLTLASQHGTHVALTPEN